MAHSLYRVKAALGSRPVLVALPLLLCTLPILQDPDLLPVAGIEVVRLNADALFALVIMGGSVIAIERPLARACIRNCHSPRPVCRVLRVESLSLCISLVCIAFRYESM